MLLKNALVLRDAFSVPKKADILIEDGVIKKVKDHIEGDGTDLSGKLIMPALYNTHTHAAMTLMRGISDDDPLDVWLFKKVLPLEEKLTGEMVYYGTMLAMMEMASCGTAGFVDMYFFLEDIARAVKDFGMRALITRGLVDEGGDDDGRLKENLEFAKKWHGCCGKILAGLGPHSPYLCSQEYLKKVARAAREYELSVTIHMYEASWEREKYRAKDILSIFKSLRLIIAHGVHFRENEFDLLKEEGFFVSHNPSSNLKLGNGIAPVSEMMETGVKVTFGTDGAASNNSLDLWHEMRIATLLQKMKDPTNMKLEQVLFMATELGAKAMGINAGKIEEGMEADLVVVDLKDVQMMPLENLKSHLVHTNTCKAVYATMVKGEWIYWNGSFPKIEERDIIEGFRKSFKKLMEG